MNANVLTIDSICSKQDSGSTPQKVDANSENKPFSMILDDMSPKDAPCKSTTSNNIDINEQKEHIDKTLDQSGHPLSEQADTENLSENPNGAGSEELNSISDIKELPDLEFALWADQYGLIGQISHEAGKVEVKIQLDSLSPNTQESLPLVAGEIVEPAEIELVSTDVSQPISGCDQGGIFENTPTVINHLEGTENTGMISITTPSGVTSQTHAQAEMDSIEELIPDAHTNTKSMRVTNENNPITLDPSALVDIQEKPESMLKDPPLDVPNNDDSKTTTGSEKPTTMDTNLTSTQVKIPETQFGVVEVHSDKRMQTDNAISELQYPKDKEPIHTEDSLTNTFGMKVLHTNEFQTSTDQPEAQNRPTENYNLKQHITQLHIQNNNPTPIIQQSITSAEDTQPSPLPEQPPPDVTSVDVSKQVLESIQSSLMHRTGDQQITVRLNPPELGKVFIKFQEQNSELTGLLEVNKAETRIEIEQALPQMIRDLADCGIQIRRLDVMLSEENRSGYGTLQDPSLQNNGPYEQDSADSQTQDNDLYSNGMSDWLPNNESYQQITEPQEILINDRSVNVLI